MAARLHGVDGGRTVSRGRGRRAPAGPRAADPRRPDAGPRPARRRDHRRSARSRKEGDARPSARRQRGLLRVQLHRDRGRGRRGAPATCTIARHVTVSDVGKALNPLQVRMQDEGAAIMGLGHTLMEHFIFDDDGRIRNLGAIDYRIPTSMDLPLELESDDRRERRRTGAVRRQGHERGRAPVRRAGRCRRRPRRDGRGRPRPAADPGAGLAGAAANGSPKPPRRCRHDHRGPSRAASRRCTPEQRRRRGPARPRGPPLLARGRRASRACRCSPAIRRSRSSTTGRRAGSGSPAATSRGGPSTTRISATWPSTSWRPRTRAPTSTRSRT